MSKILLSVFILFVCPMGLAASEWQTLVNEVNNGVQFKKDQESSQVFRVTAKSLENKPNVTAADAEAARTIQAKMALQNELFLADLEKGVLASFRTSLENMNPALIQNALTEKMVFSNLSDVDTLKTQETDKIRYAETSDLRQMTGSNRAFRDILRKYMSAFHKIEFAEMKIVDGQSKQMKSVFSEQPEFFVIANLDVRGMMLNGRPRADKAVLKISFEKKDKQYLVSDFLVLNLLTTRLDRTPAFDSTAANYGFDDGKVYNRLEALRRGGYGLAIEDFNNDGELDAFVGNYGESTLWLGKNGRFVRADAPTIERITLAKAAAFADFDNDGWKDLFITRFAADKLVGDIVLFKNNKGTFTEVKNPFPSNILRDYAMPSAIADYNNDGLLDIYVGFPGSRDFSAGPRLNPKSEIHGLFINKGGFRFEDQTESIKAAYQTPIFPHGALATDFNSDGLMDIIAMDDQMNLSPVYANKGNGQFVLKNNSTRILNYGYGMGVATGDFNQDGQPDYLLSNATFNSQLRVDVLNREGIKSHMDISSTNQGVRLFINQSGEDFVEKTKIAGLNDPGEAAGGVTVIDYDNDGLQDIYLVNGLWSGSSRDEKIDSYFALATKLKIAAIDHIQDGVGDRRRDGTQSIFMRALINEKTSGNKTLSFAGYQRNRLFKNLGNGNFLEVGYLEGVDSMADGYMSVVADLNKDNKPDLILRNCDPGAKDNMFPPVQVFKNRHSRENSLWITLKGIKSNSHGAGAKVTAMVGDTKLFREMPVNNSALQGEMVVHIGLGLAKKADKLVIKWPTGMVDTYTNISAGKHSFTEKQQSIAVNQ